MTTNVGIIRCALALTLPVTTAAAQAVGANAAGVAASSVDAASGETIVVVGRPAEAATTAARDRDRALGDTPFVSVLHPDDHPATASVADAIATAVGAQTRSLGGLGAYESVSIRGNAPGQTTVFVDGVPLSRLAAVTTDLGRFSLDSFGEVDLYRGDVPIELGGAGIGGAVDLITRLGRDDQGDRLRVSAGVGSFGARHLRAHYGDSHLGGAWLSSMTIGYQAATGDFSFYDPNGTPLTTADDHTSIRRNNQFWQVDGATRVGRADGSAAGGVRIADKQQGLPGSVAEPSPDASLGTLDAIADARADAQVGAAIVRTSGYAVVEDQRLHDPHGELGLGDQDRRSLTLSGGGESTWSVALARTARLVTGGELRGDHFRDATVIGDSPTVVGSRLGGAALAAIDFTLARQLVVTPAIRLDVERTAPAALTTGPEAFEPSPARWDVVASPRIGARAPIFADVSIKASTGEYERRPTLIELFGDRGFVLGSPTLRPETGTSSDAGVVWAPARAIAGGAIDRVLVEVDAFATRSHDTITFVTFAGYVSRATNLGETETYGGELVGSARIAKRVTLTANYTRLASAQIEPGSVDNGEPIPRDPAHLAYARGELAHAIAGHAATLWVEVAAQSQSTIDPAGLGIVPGRALLGTGATFAIVPRRLAVAIDVANAADVRVEREPLSPPPSPTFTSTPVPLQDVAGFPLPGRSFYVSLIWTN